MAQTYFSKTPKFNPAAFSQGTNLGMFSPSSQEPKSSFGSIQNILRQMSEAGIDTKSISAEKILDYATANQFLNPYTDREQDWKFQKQALDYAAELQEKQAERRQKFGEGSIGKAVLYQALANIGPTIAQAVNPSYLMEAGTRISSAANEAFRSVPSMNVQAPGYNLTQFRYFQ